MRKKKRKKNNIIKILPYFKKYKLLYIICFLMMLLTDLGTIIYGGIIGEVTQSLISGKIKKALLLLLIYITIEIISNIINRIREYLSNKNQIIISRKIGFDTYDKAMKLPAYAYEKMSSGEVINRITNDTENIVGSIDQLMNIASYVISAAVLLIYIFLNSWILGIEIIIFLIVFSYIIKFFQSKLKIIKKDDNDGKALEGVEFNIIDENGEIKYSKVKTNEKGEIIIDGILPGKYFIEEVSTKQGYIKLNNKVEFDIDLNEEVEVTITNEKEKEEPKKEKTHTEKNYKLPVTGM